MQYNSEVKMDLLSVKKNTRTILIGLSLLCTTAPALAGWQVQWIDKFEGDGVDWDNWTAQTEANYNAESQCYTDDDSSDIKNYDVSDGTLKIIARKGTVSCEGLDGTTKTWTSGRLNSKDKSEFLYGRIESKIRFEADADELAGGTWPAFWMLENRINQQPVAGDDDTSSWPQEGAGEIDIWEWFSNSPDSYITNFFNTEKYYYGSDTCGSQVNYTYPNGSTDVQDWHIYAMEWAEDEISFYIDDTLVSTQDVSDCTQYEESMFVLLNVAMGGNLGGTIDSGLEMATMDVDYVAHCYASDDSDAAYCNEAAPEGTTDYVAEETSTTTTTTGASMNYFALICLSLMSLFRRRKNS
jgi:beta-glucanase (GH16 family)